MSKSEAELAAIYEFEQALAEGEQPTSTPAIIAWHYVGLPQDVRGFRILDVASGTCPLVAKLVEAGADAHGVDSVYAKSIDTVMEEARIFAYQVAYQAGRFGQDMLNSQFAQIDVFRRSFELHPERYHPGYMTRLNFPRNSFDWVVSNCGLLVLGENPDATEEAINCFIAVTRPGGTVSVSPWPTDQDDYQFEEDVIDVYADVMERLSRNNVGNLIIDRRIQPESPIPMRPVNRLRIIKN